MAEVEETARVLLGSGGIATDQRRALYRELVAKHFSGCETVLFVPFASHDHEAYISRMQDFLRPSGPRLVGIQEMDHSGGWPKDSGSETETRSGGPLDSEPSESEASRVR